MDRRGFLKLSALAAGVSLAGAGEVLAHHGWAWATDKVVEVSGVIKKVKLGNPHGELMVDVKGVMWEAEIGQPWRNKRAGLTDNLLKIGTEVTISGHRAKDPKLKVIKANKVIIAGKSYILYPERAS